MAWLVGIVVLILLVASGSQVCFESNCALQNESEESRSRSRIPLSELVFENVTLKPDYSSYKMSGRVKNNSAKFTLTQVGFVVTMQDCTGESPSSNCITIGQSSEDAYFNIPPGQARDFEGSVYVSGTLKPQGRLEWHYSVAHTRGE